MIGLPYPYSPPKKEKKNRTLLALSHIYNYKSLVIPGGLNYPSRGK